MLHSVYFRKFQVLLAIALLFTLQSCEEDKDDTIVGNRSLKVRVHLVQGDTEISLSDTVTLNNNYDVVLDLFRVYVSNFILVKSDNSEMELSTLALINPGDDIFNEFTLPLPQGEYKSLKFAIGLDATTNDSDPSSFSNDNPLSSYQSMYWSMLKYRFAKVEGRANLSGSLGSSSDILIAYHPGRDEAYRTKTHAFPITVDNLKSHSYTMDMYFDINDIFVDGIGGSIDFTTESQTHSTLSEMPLTNKIMDNLKSSNSVQAKISTN